MVSAVVLSGHDPQVWSGRYARGDAPSPLPYGVDVLAAQGWDLFPVGGTRLRRVAKIRDVVEHRSGMSIERPVRAVRRVGRSDVVIALLEREGLLPGYLRAMGVPPWSRTPLMIWSCWLADDLSRADRDRRRWLVDRVRGADLIAHLSRHETGILVEAGIAADRLVTMTYGVSHRFYVPGNAERDIAFLAVGQDRGRDYATLLAAISGSALTVDLVTTPQSIAGLTVPHNVRAHGTVPLAQYRALLQRAQVVLVPTKDMAYPTGSSVALEAAASGCAVIATGTRAMRDYFTDGQTALLVDPGDVDGWRTAMSRLIDDAQARVRLGASARRSVEDRFNADVMWTELAEQMRRRSMV